LTFFLRLVLAPLVGLAALVAAGGVAYREYRQWTIAGRRAIDTPRGIETLEAVRLGGVDQWIQIRGRDTSNPVLLFLHGGPGTPGMPLGHVFQDAWEDHFTVVHWDQRGAGKSYSDRVPRESLTIAQLVADAEELIGHLRRRLGEDRVYLLGHSYGTVIGIRVALARPEWLHAYVGVGQVVDLEEAVQRGYASVLARARTAGDRKALEELEAMGAPPWSGDDAIPRSYRFARLRVRFGDYWHGRTDLWPVLLGYWMAPEYSLRDMYRLSRGLDVSGEAFFDEQPYAGLRSLGLRFDVPLYFVFGREDRVTPGALLEPYLERMEAPHKEIVWIDGAAHFPFMEAPDRFADLLVDRVSVD
jgi:pimeloyl-ACP methyl ester carboxylesterase